MRKTSGLSAYLFPLLFGLGSLLCFVLVYHPRPFTQNFTTALLTMFSAAACSAVVRYADTRRRGFIRIAFVALAAALAWVELAPSALIDYFFHRVIFWITLLGVVEILFYLSLLDRRSTN